MRLSPPKKGTTESFKTFWKYDSSNRRILENDQRISNSYSYYKNSHLLYAQYTSYNGRIQIRNFYRYDDSGAICEEVTDDGSSKVQEDLTDVTERLFKNIINTPTGLPEVIEEYCLNESAGKKELIRRTVNAYDRHGWMIAQSIYDCEGTLSYTLEWQYDSHGNVILEKDALGYVTIFPI